MPSGTSDERAADRPQTVGPARAEQLEREPNRLKRFVRVLGPGLIAGAANDDPSAIGTFAAAGASLGFGLLWAPLAVFPLLTIVQTICARVGMVTGRGLAGVLRRRYPPWVVYPAVLALAAANTIQAGADIGAVAAAVHLLVPEPATVFVAPLAVALLALQVLASYQFIARAFKWLTLALFAYVGAGLLGHPETATVLKATFVPAVTLGRGYLVALVAILGSALSPYLLFWQSSQQVEEEIEQGRQTVEERRGATDAELKYATWDVVAGMFFAMLVAYFILLATAEATAVTGVTSIESAADAAAALRPVAGSAAAWLWATGLIGAGALAVPILTGSAAYAISEAFGWRHGFSSNPRRAKRFYAVIALSTLLGALINFAGWNPISALVIAAVINGALTPLMLVLVMLIASDRGIMGERAIGPRANILGWGTTALTAVAVLALGLTLPAS